MKSPNLNSSLVFGWGGEVGKDVGRAIIGADHAPFSSLGNQPYSFGHTDL